MKIDEIWLIEYADDGTFYDRLKEVTDKIMRYRIVTGDVYIELCKDHQIPAFRRSVYFETLHRGVKNYLKVPFYK